MAEEVKTSRRGITRETRSKGSKKFKPNMDKNKGLNMTTVEWEIRRKETPDDTKQTSFIGGIIPTLVLTFKGITSDEKEEAPIYIHSFRPIEDDESYRDSVEDGMFQFLKHFMETALGRELSDKEYDSLVLDIPENPKGEEVLAGYDKFFKGILNVLKPVSDGETRMSDIWWMKLLRYIRKANGETKEVNRGELGLTSYPGAGIFERFVQGVECSLEINIAKGEDIEPKKDIAPAAPLPGADNGTGAGDTKVTKEDMPEWLKKKMQKKE